MPNEKRGEVELNLDGRSYILRPSFETIQDYETVTGKGSTELLGHIARATCPFMDLVNVLWSFVKRSKPPFKGRKIEFGDLLLTELGVSDAAIIVGLLMTNVCLSPKQKAELDDDEEGENEEADPQKPSEDQTPTSE